MRKTIVVVGAGIIGASIAYHLASRGARVLVLDAAEPGGNATGASWAWINASWGNPHFYFRFRTRSMREWRCLAKEVAGMHVRWCGGLLWDLPRDRLEAFVGEHRSWGYGVRFVDRAEALRIEPDLREAPDVAVLVAEEGVVEPLAASEALLAASRELGAEIRGHAHVKRLLVDGGRVTGLETEEESVAADEIVLAAGAGTPPLAASAGVRVPITTPAGLLVHSKPVEKVLNGLVLSPELHVRQTAEGRLVAGSDFGGAEPGLAPETAARSLFAKVQDLLKNGESLELDFHTVGYRPTPADELPIISRVPGVVGLYVAVMHSGITNAAAVGLMASREIMDGERDELLAPFDLERFSQEVI
jgi:glycine/D-amino acid oxidase-like deaminating enzyme